MSTNSPLLTIVLSTPELFEAILLRMNLRDLLFAQTVCRAWKDTITTSPALQRKLFFAPIRDKDQDPYFNPLLQELFPCFFKLGPAFSVEDVLASHIKEQEWFKNAKSRDTVLREQASWRRMLPVQPPAQIDTVKQHMCCCGYLGGESYFIEPEFQHLQANGAPMGLIYDILVHLLDKDSYLTIFVEWHMFPEDPPTTEATGEVVVDAVRLYELQEEHRLGFQPESRITLHEMTVCHESAKVLSGLWLRDLEKGMILFSE